MTQYLEEAVGKHVLAVEASLAEMGGKYMDNLYYTSLHADGEVTHHMDRVCFADLRYALGGEDDDDDEDVFRSSAPITHVILHKYGLYLNPERGDLDGLHRALDRWAELFSAFMTIREEAIIVDLRQANVDCVGAALVGFRNLSEQNTQATFNKFADEGFTLRQAAWLSQLFDWDESKKTLTENTNGHRIREASFNCMDDKSFFDHMNNCLLFDTNHMLIEKAREGVTSLRWNIAEKYAMGGRADDCWKMFQAVNAAERVKSGWGGMRWNLKTEQAIKFLKDNRA